MMKIFEILICGRFIPTKKNASSWKLDKEIKKSLVRLIGRRSTEDDGKEKQEDSVKDLLGLMINASTNLRASNQAMGPMTVHDIVEECKTFFFAGKQTTSNLLTWATVLLAMHPTWQEQAREEVLEVCGSELPNKDHLFKLKTVLFH
jgi:PHYB activation tagged suppressor 1